MRKLFLLAVCCSVMFTTASAQGFEVGGFIGVTNYMGDLTPGHYEAREFNLAGGLIARYNYHQNLTFKASLLKGRLSGSDVHSGTEDGRRQRNLGFQSEIYEFSAQAEFNLLGYNLMENVTQLTPYFFGGIGGFYFNPKAFYEREWHELQPLGTEGQGLPGGAEAYSKFQLCIPMGAGLKISLSQAVNFWMEMGVRKTFTDYLDDVSTTYPQLDELGESKGALAATLSYRKPEYAQQYANHNPAGQIRGNPNADDWYAMIGAGLTFNLGLSNFGQRPIPRGKPVF